MANSPSQESIDLVIACEVSSRAYYEKFLSGFDWPGGKSGPTVGIGYDLGYTNAAKLQADWSDVVDTETWIRMKPALGLAGAAAKNFCAAHRRNIKITWDQAGRVFLKRDVPAYCAELFRAIPAAADLPPDCVGALFSIGYNRGNGGWTSSGDRFLEMRQIRDAVQGGHPDQVPALIRAMKRHWPSDAKGSVDRGLRIRRDKEANLFAQGLKNRTAPIAPAPTVVRDKPAVTLPTQAAPASSHAATGGVVVATAAVAKDADRAGWSTPEIAIMIVIGIILAFVVWKLVNKWHAAQNPVLARAKDAPEEPAPAAPKANP